MKDFSKDTYFYNVEDAILEAKQNNKVFIGHPTIFGKQICYYNAEKEIDGLPENCIYVPIDNFFEYFLTTYNRLPTRLVIFEDDIKGSSLLCEALEKSLKILEVQRKNFMNNIINEISKQKPNFNDEKLRVFISTSLYTQVLQYVQKGVYNVLKNNDKYDVKFFIDDEFGGIDNLDLISELYKFNPHIIISVNYKFDYVHKDVFQFIWYQDYMPFLADPKPYQKREREYFFALTKFFGDLLKAKGIPFERQNFLINDSLFRVNQNIKREEKIVFIGSSYINSFKSLNCSYELINLLVDDYEKGKIFSEEYIKELSERFGDDFNDVRGKLLPYIVRDYTVRWLCSSELSKKIKIEIYGRHWEIYPETKKYFKGELNHGQDLIDVYSSAKYALAPHADCIIQQRTLEAIFCGCQPILYDCRALDDSNTYENCLIYFRSKEELLKSFTKTNEENFEEFKKDFSYKKFVDKILNIVETNR